MEMVIIEMIFVVVVVILTYTIFRLSKMLKKAQSKATDFEQKYKRECDVKYALYEKVLTLEKDIKGLQDLHPENLNIDSFKDCIASMTRQLEKQIGGRIKVIRYFRNDNSPVEFEIE